uniref:Resolvase, N-terminal domain n=1 Tax=mine drainage metagenome TaxID=410659 RepID=E6PBZ3_9ZZZZ
MMQFDKPVAVAYYRVSTQKQGRSGLGLDAQQSAVEAFCNTRGLKLDAAYTEVESGKRTDRTELAKAFAKARRLRGVLVIAKLDRLARDVHFVSGLIKQGVAFACVDAPDDDAMMLHVRATFAENEALKISERTKAALAAAKARGKKLGNPQNLTDDGRARGSRNGAAAMKARGAENRDAIRNAVLDARTRGLSLRAIAEEVGCGTMTASRILKAEGAE